MIANGGDLSRRCYQQLAEKARDLGAQYNGRAAQHERTESMTETSDTMLGLIPAQPGWEAMEPTFDYTGKRIVGLRHLPVIAWRIMEERDGDETLAFVEPVTVATVQDFGTPLKDPNGRMLSGRFEAVMSEAELIAILQEEHEASHKKQ
jgi:hypothetical protein